MPHVTAKTRTETVTMTRAGADAERRRQYHTQRAEQRAEDWRRRDERHAECGFRAAVRDKLRTSRLPSDDWTGKRERKRAAVLLRRYIAHPFGARDLACKFCSASLKDLAFDVSPFLLLALSCRRCGALYPVTRPLVEVVEVTLYVDEQCQQDWVTNEGDPGANALPLHMQSGGRFSQ